MSVELDVKITKDIKIEDLLHLASQELQLLLALSAKPKLSATELELGVEIEINPRSMLADGQLLLVSCEGLEDARVRVLVIDFSSHFHKSM